MKRPAIRFQPARHKRVALGHPWVYSNEIVMDPAAKALPPGTLVDFVAHDGMKLGWGSFNPRTLIAGRVFDRTPLGTADADWFARKIELAVKLRARLVPEPFYRLIHAEADGLPGLIVDRFDDVLSLQINTAGMELLTTEILDALTSVLSPCAIILHNESSVRTLEGLGQETKLAKGEIMGLSRVRENGLTYFADLMGGQKTGWYFDQRDNHALLARYAKNQDVLDVCCHAGGFALLAARQGAKRTVGVDASQSALDLAKRGAEENNLSPLCTWHRADMFDDLTARAEQGERFGLVIADPPPFVKSRKDLAAGARGYRKLTRLAAKVTAPQGLLAVMSCSHNMTQDMLTEEVARGLAEAHRQGRILHTLTASPDHPTHPAVPETNYLHGVVVALD